MATPRRRRLGDQLLQASGLFVMVMPRSARLAALSRSMCSSDGAGRLSWQFLTSLPSRRASQAGLATALVGSVYVILPHRRHRRAASALARAIYLEEYGERGRMARLIEINIANLAGVPSIIYGLLGLGLFVRTLGLGRSLIAGAATLALLVLPVVILSTREALRTVPNSLREGSYALGATKWQTIWTQVLPMAMPGILTGLILALSRAIGETAPLITIGAITYVPFLPDGLSSPFTVLPIQIFNWVSRPQAEFLRNAAAAILVLVSSAPDDERGRDLVARPLSETEDRMTPTPGTPTLPSLSGLTSKAHAAPSTPLKIDVTTLNFYYGRSARCTTSPSRCTRIR